MADRIWDILRFLKNSDGAAGGEAAKLDAKEEKNQINAQLINALEVLVAEPKDAPAGEDLSAEESEVLTVEIDDMPVEVQERHRESPPSVIRVRGEPPQTGLKEIPTGLRETEPLTQQIIALVENIQRKNLSAIEEAACLQDIISKTGWSQMETSKRMGRSQASIANKLILLRLDQIGLYARSVEDLVLSGKLGERQARSLLSLSMEEQRFFTRDAVGGGLSAKALEALAESWDDRPERKPEKKKASSEEPAGELLGDLSILINKYRKAGISAQWRVKQMDQSSLVIEISVDLTEDGDRRPIDGE